MICVENFCPAFFNLKMLCLYLDTLTIGLCSMLSSSNKKALQKKCQHFMPNHGLWIKNVKTQQQQKNQTNIKILVKPGNPTQNSGTCSLLCNLSATETTECIDWSLAFFLFHSYVSKHKQTKSYYWNILNLLLFLYLWE